MRYIYRITSLLNNCLIYLENKLFLKEELTQEDKKKLNEIYIEISKEWKKWKNSKFIGTIEGREDNVKSLIKNLMTKAAELKPSIEELKSLTKNGITKTEEEELKIWDYCEKMLTELQNKMANGNVELQKHTIINNGKKIVQNPNWTDACLNETNNSSIITNYFNY